MKRITGILALALSIVLLSACGGQGQPEESPPAVAGDEPAGDRNQPEAGVTVACRIVDGAEDGTLLLAELDDGGTAEFHDGKSVYRLTLTDEIAVYLDGEEAAAADLQDGMPVAITFNGIVMETFPAQLGEVRSVSAYSIGTRQNPGGSYYDLCGLYLKVLDDLWNADPGLNDDITIAGLDLSQAPGGLLDSEKAALARRFGELHNVEVVTGTHEELVEQGYITVVPDDPEKDCIPGPYWEDGCLFSIRLHETEDTELYSLPVLRFDADKWRTPLGAYCFYDCAAVWPEMGTWDDYTVGDEMIA